MAAGPSLPGTAGNAAVIVDTTTVLSLTATLVLLIAAYGLSLRLLPSATTTSIALRVLFVWHAFDALIHFILEGSFLYNCFFSSAPVSKAELAAAAAGALASSPSAHSSSSPGWSSWFPLPPFPIAGAPYAGGSAAAATRAPLRLLTAPGVHFLADPSRQHGAFYGTNPMAALWREYAKADARWGGADPVVVSIELLTVGIAGPLAAYVCWLLVRQERRRGARKQVAQRSKQRRGKGRGKGKGDGEGEGLLGGAASFWASVLATGELYGGFMTFAPEWLTGNTNLDTSNFMYLWVYLFFFNMLWVAFPVWVLREAYVSVVANDDDEDDGDDAGAETAKTK